MALDEDEYTNDGTVDINKNPANKSKTGNWKACRFILGNECCERLAYYGMSTNLVNYLQKQLSMGNAEAANSVTNWSGTCYVTPLLGAFLADSYLGRYWTIAIFSIIYVFGMGFLSMTAAIPGLKPTCDSSGCNATSSQVAACFVALYMIALGTGGIKPCVSSFGADQFDETDEREKIKKSSFFNWFYMSINFGAMIASSVLVYIQMNVGWDWGFGIPAVAMAVAVVFFFVGSPLYRIQKPGGSPITRIIQVIVASFRSFSVKVPDDKSLLYETRDAESSIQGSRKLEHTDKLSFFDKAAVEDMNNLKNPWKVCTVTQVEELKAVIRLLPIWAAGIVFAAVYSQMSTMFVLQGNTMDQHMGPNFKIPSASLSLFDTVSVLIWAPVYDLVIVPVARKFTGHPRGFTQLQRMGIGLVISVFSMVAAGVLEVVRLKVVQRNNYYEREYIPMTIFWQVPQYFLIGCAEVFTFIGQLEFFYDQAPDAMRSLCTALSLTTIALGNYLSTALVTTVTKVTTRNGQLGWIPDNLNRGHLDYYYWVLTILSIINFLVYLMVAKWYTTLQTRRFPSRKNSILRCSKSNNSDSESETPSPEGDAQKQEMLVRIAMIEAEKVRLGQFLDDKSEFLTKFGEDTNAEFDKIGEDALKGLDEATARIMGNMDSRMQAFEESTGVNISEIEENEIELAAFEDQIEKERNEGLFFQNLTEGKPIQKVDTTKAIKKITEFTKKSAGSETRRNIYLVLIGLILIETVNSFTTSTPDWRRIAFLGVILAGLVTQLVFEQKLLSETEIADDMKTEEEKR